MFFFVSKVFWLVAQPISLVFILLVTGICLLVWRRGRSATVVLALAALVQFSVVYTSLGYLLIQPLENRFSVPQQVPANVSAIVLLGGATMARPSTTRQVAELNQAGDRLTTTLWLAQRYPAARIVLSGGGGFLMGETESEAETMRRFLVGLGVDETRLVLESESMNTAENASFTRETLEGEMDNEGAVLLVTSAFHMPRAMGIYRKQGLDMVPWPTDFRSSGDQGPAIDLANPNQNLETTTVALREWIGLVAYSLSGRSEGLFPGP